MSVCQGAATLLDHATTLSQRIAERTARLVVDTRNATWGLTAAGRVIRL